jgi:tetratricopeptide (TPR) repeat protein
MHATLFAAAIGPKFLAMKRSLFATDRLRWKPLQVVGLGVAILVGMGTGRMAAAETNQLDSNESLFTVMAALHAAGYDADMQSPNNNPLRALLVANLKSKNLTTGPEIRDWLQRRRLGPEGLELTRFISFALSVSGPPNFNYKYPAHELPPDVIPLEGFEMVLTRFYKEAGIAELYKQAQPAVERELERLQPDILNELGQSNAYLRNPTSGFLGRRLQILVELIAPPNHVQTRAYKDDFYLVLSPTPDVPRDYIRYAYLQYLLDPLVFKYKAKLDAKRSLIDLAQAAPALDDHYKEDFGLLATASLIKAVEARMDKAKGAAHVDQALREGFVLAPYFFEALGKYEQQEVSMKLYYPEMIDQIDLKKEDKRLASVDFVKEKPTKKIRVVAAEEKLQLTGVFKTLEQGEELYGQQKFDAARDAFLKALQETDEKPLHAKSYYGLARTALRQRNPELADQLFRKVLELNPDGATHTWSLVYLGRLADSQKEREQAETFYRTALTVTGGSETAKKAAQQGLDAPFGTKKEK